MPSLASSKGSFASTTSMMAASENGIDDAPLEDRRDIFKAGGVAASALGFFSLFPDLSYAEDISGMGTQEHPIVVLGAGGKV
jgi:hypothetical protein